MDYTMSGNLPIAYASIGGKLPFTGLSTKGEIIVGSDGDATLTDVQAELQYNFVQSLLLDLGAKVGYRYMSIDADKDDIKYKLDFKGPYIGLNAHF
jgi:outer membrane protein